TTLCEVTTLSSVFFSSGVNAAETDTYSHTEGGEEGGIGERERERERERESQYLVKLNKGGDFNNNTIP
ncbi:MAG: hypothetical protein J8272_00980, partial ['Prunus persica' phytoplasma PP2]|nr:hypothetical protein ['Prunus persica' phytoplasma PP2]